MFFLAAYDTSAVTTSNTLYELALNHTIQDRLREEIKNVYAKNNGEITFDDINTMFYLDAVVKGNFSLELILKKFTQNKFQRNINISSTFHLLLLLLCI